MKDKAFKILRSKLGEEESRLDHDVMGVLVDGLISTNMETQYSFALYTNLLIEFKDKDTNRYKELQYYISDDINHITEMCGNVLKKMSYKTDEMLRLEGLINPVVFEDKFY